MANPNSSFLRTPSTRFALSTQSRSGVPEAIDCPLCGSRMPSLDIECTYVCSVCGTSLQLECGQHEAWIGWIEWGSLRFPTF